MLQIEWIRASHRSERNGGRTQSPVAFTLRFESWCGCTHNWLKPPPLPPSVARQHTQLPQLDATLATATLPNVPPAQPSLSIRELILANAISLIGDFIFSLMKCLLIINWPVSTWKFPRSPPKKEAKKKTKQTQNKSRHLATSCDDQQLSKRVYKSLGVTT